MPACPGLTKLVILAFLFLSAICELWKPCSAYRNCPLGAVYAAPVFAVCPGVIGELWAVLSL